MPAPSGPPGPPPPGAPPPTYGGGPGGPGRSSRKIGWIIAAVIVVLALIGGGIALVVTMGDDADQKADDSSSTSASDKPSDDTTDETTDPTEMPGPTDATTTGGVAPETDCDGKFASGSSMAGLSAAGRITVGVRFDQPGLGFRDPASTAPTGFDIAIAKLLIADLCIDPESSSVTWQEVLPDQREPMLQSRGVDLIIATYSITDERRRVIGQAGPYLVTGQQLLVRTSSTIASLADLKGKKVCGIAGSTSAQVITSSGAVLDPANSYAECVGRVANGDVEATSTDGAILLGLAGQTTGVKVVGPELSEERYGIGYPPRSSEMCAWINGVLDRAFVDGTWANAFDENLGGAGVATPSPPAVDSCG